MPLPYPRSHWVPNNILASVSSQKSLSTQHHLCLCLIPEITWYPTTSLSPASSKKSLGTQHPCLLQHPSNHQIACSCPTVPFRGSEIILSLTLSHLGCCDGSTRAPSASSHCDMYRFYPSCNIDFLTTSFQRLIFFHCLENGGKLSSKPTKPFLHGYQPLGMTSMMALLPLVSIRVANKMSLLFLPVQPIL